MAGSYAICCDSVAGVIDTSGSKTREECVMYKFVLFVVFTISSLALGGCGQPPLMGKWKGHTQACEVAEDDDTSVLLTIVVAGSSNDEAALLFTSLGLPDAALCGGDPPIVDAWQDSVSFARTITCDDGRRIDYEVELALESDDALAGTVTYSGEKTCAVELMRLE
ncbi:hypothetical protein OV203_22470 [Nannocystis sp. ILAH1]|uniref:hypothetical protein n=1 Tax=Nannocystis sp. ILAH1 TaxID=2996789 RepID=UPI0022717E1A|nr:hypothetical protein [Nannocystis sp. ILAH1]MCY0989921.1 hypothetical protein [Nannocystis sp. ILAH1]